jgi:hypothetical protein
MMIEKWNYTGHMQKQVITADILPSILVVIDKRSRKFIALSAGERRNN